MKIEHVKLAALKAAIVLLPSYTAAWLTGQMVWVVPTLAAASFFAANIGATETLTQRRVDEDGAETGSPDETAVDHIEEEAGE